VPLTSPARPALSPPCHHHCRSTPPASRHLAPASSPDTASLPDESRPTQHRCRSRPSDAITASRPNLH
jgi:hypothetical protein